MCPDGIVATLSPMRLSTTTRYAVRIMIDIAQHEKTTLGSIVKRQEISGKYSEQIIAELRRAGLTKSIRGTHGGYVLARPAQEITMGQIVRAVDGPYVASEDLRDEPIEAAIEHAQAALWKVLDGLTLAEIAVEGK